MVIIRIINDYFDLNSFKNMPQFFVVDIHCMFKTARPGNVKLLSNTLICYHIVFSRINTFI